MLPRIHRLLILLVVALAAVSSPRAHDWHSSDQMAAAARAWLASLDAEQIERARFDFEAAERGRWSNLPALIVPPSGLMLADMNDEQRRGVHALLRASMSSQGYGKFAAVMRLEEVLHELASRRLAQMPESERSPLQVALAEGRDPELYAIAVFGEPGSQSWGWQFSGHHAAANFTVSDGRVAFTPTFLGSSPRIIDSGPHAGTMALPHEGDRGIGLMQALDPEQRARAQVAEALPEGIFSGPGRKDSLTEFEGLPASELDEVQLRLLRALIEEYVANADFDVADAQMAAIEAAGWSQLWFSWRGPIDPEGRFYYRVHGPRILIEYNRVDENHDHSIVRDPRNDYGADWLGQHLTEYHPSSEEIREGMRQRIEGLDDL